MIGVFVTFRYGDKFDEQAVRKIADTARVTFEGMPGPLMCTTVAMCVMIDTIRHRRLHPALV
jgi:hypothetical protein